MALRILIVEDYPINREMLCEMLAELDHAVTAVGDGSEAVETIRTGGTFDVIFMDFEMPTMDGVEATRHIRALPGQAQTLIIGISAGSEVYHRQCIEAGMNDTLGKPFTESDLQHILHKWFPAGASPAPTSTPAQTAPASEQSRRADNGDPVQDYPRALAEFQGDQELLDNLLAEFVLQIDRQTIRIQAAIQANDLLTVRKEAHSIKGGSLNLAARELAETARLLETTSGAHDADGLRAAYAGFSAAVARFKQRIQNREVLSSRDRITGTLPG